MYRMSALLLVMSLLVSGCAAAAQEAPAVALEPTVAPTFAAPPTTVEPTVPPTLAAPAPAANPVVAGWLQANPGGAAVTGLLYFAPSRPGGSIYALWRLPLTGDSQPKKLSDIPTRTSFPPGGSLSADGAWVAYTLNDEPFELRVMRVDGTDERLLAHVNNISSCD